jgi:hypothetical protein
MCARTWVCAYAVVQHHDMYVNTHKHAHTIHTYIHTYIHTCSLSCIPTHNLFLFSCSSCVHTLKHAHTIYPSIHTYIHTYIHTVFYARQHLTCLYFLQLVAAIVAAWGLAPEYKRIDRRATNDRNKASHSYKPNGYDDRSRKLAEQASRTM